MSPITELEPLSAGSTPAELVVDADKTTSSTRCCASGLVATTLSCRIGVVLDPRPGGAFAGLREWQWRHVRRVAFVERPRTFSITGQMGISGAVSAVWTMTLAPLDDDPSRTKVTLTHRGYGDIDDETAQSYAVGWQEVLQTLARAAA